MVVVEVERFEGLGTEGRKTQVVGTRICKRCWSEVYSDIGGTRKDFGGLKEEGLVG